MPSEEPNRKSWVYSSCVRASLSKCYEFNLIAWDEQNAASAFFCLPTLRGICEEVIVLHYLHNIPRAERDRLLTKLMTHEVHSRLVTQHAFFAATRPMQPILQPRMSPSAVQILEDEIRSIWRAHGWPKMKQGVIPPIRQIAQKDGGDILAKLYDYLYRLTSGTVHFSVGALLRTGWRDKHNYTFSVQHFDAYYTAFGRIYGAFMFCVYFELFARLLRPGNKAGPKIDDIRNSIRSIFRWPEMVTFEEMNVRVPEPNVIVRALGAVLSQRSKGLLAR